MGICVESIVMVNATIVIVDDDPLFAKRLQDWLKKEGFSEVVVCLTVNDALRKARDVNRGLFAVDVNFGDTAELAGIECVRNLAALRRKDRRYLIVVLAMRRIPSVGQRGSLAQDTEMPDIEAMALDAGADIILWKDTKPEADALSLKEAILADLEKETASVRVETVRRLLRHYCERAGSDLSNRNWNNAASQVDRALDLAQLSRQENLILWTLKQGLARSPRDKKLANVIDRGLTMLRGEFSDDELMAWLREVTQSVPSATRWERPTMEFDRE